jgi:hypothetical protein
LETAIHEAASLAGIDQYQVNEYPAQKDFWVSLIENTSDNVQTRFARLLTTPEQFRWRRYLRAMEGYDFRQALVPYVLD